MVDHVEETSRSYICRMTRDLYLPIDVVMGRPTDFDQAADFLELSAFFANTSTVLISELTNKLTIGPAEDHTNMEQLKSNSVEEIVNGTVLRIQIRRRALGWAYPFDLDQGGHILTCVLHGDSFGQAAYILSLVLSNLRPVSPILNTSSHHPDADEVRKLREYFQYFATAALAAEIQGDAWTFGFPRPDHSSFLKKMKEIWCKLKDGRVEAQTGAPSHPKDDKVDVFAARLYRDQLPGFLIAVAQVATGQDARQKSLMGHLRPFKSRWFATQPVTEFIPYMIMPFARANCQFVDDVRTMGNVLHRLRVPRRVEEAKRLVQAGATIEGYDRLEQAVQWIAEYQSRGGAAA